MAKKDIYKIDNYFIRIGIVFLIFSVLALICDPSLYYDVTIRKEDSGSSTKTQYYTYENKNGRTAEEIRVETNASEVSERSFPYKRSFIAFNGLVLLLVGIAYRKRENKIIAIWNALEHTGEAKVEELSVALGLNRNFILKHLKDINGQQSSYYLWDQPSDKIVDGKLKTEFLMIADCKSCGSKVDEKVSFDVLSPPKCEYCGNPLTSSEDLNQLKKDLMIKRGVNVAEIKKEFNTTVFIALLVLFWPGAIYYAIKNKS